MMVKFFYLLIHQSRKLSKALQPQNRDHNLNPPGEEEAELLRTDPPEKHNSHVIHAEEEKQMIQAASKMSTTCQPSHA